MSTLSLKRFVTLAVLLMFVPVLALAQYGSYGQGQYPNNNVDQGQYRILSARYGTERNNVDVTQRLRELAGQDVRFRMGNSTFGVDPDPGRVKTLRIYARGRGGEERMFEYREGSTVDGTMFADWRRGNWGDSGWNGGWQGRGNGRGGDRDRDDGQYRILGARYGTARNNVDVTDRLRDLAARDLRFRMGNSTFGVDPDPGRVKTLRIFARGRGGDDRTFEYREGSVIDGSMFTGWGRGDWGRDRWRGGWGRGGDNDDDDRGRGGYGRGNDQRGELRILNASYGAGGRGRDVTALLQGYVRDGRIDITVDNFTMRSDPAPHQPKSLVVTYSVNGRQRQSSVNEGGRLSIP